MKKDILPGDVIAVGDVHATWTPYRRFLDKVEGTGAVVVLLGDIVDRGKHDILVLKETEKRILDPEKFGLQAFYMVLGNHERMFLNAAREDFGPYRTATVEWLKAGGNFEDRWVMQRHTEWLQKLPIFITIGNALFVHGGVAPGHNPVKDLREKRGDDLLWMRGAFLRKGPKLEKWTDRIKVVVHGHTPVKEPEIFKGRVNIDTGACYDDGYLTAYNVTQNRFYRFYK